MKTESAQNEPERTATFTMHLAEAALLVWALDYYARHQPVHRACGSRDMGKLIAVVKGSMREANPEDSEFFFDKLGMLKEAPYPAPQQTVREIHHHHYHPNRRPQIT